MSTKTESLFVEAWLSTDADADTLEVTLRQQLGLLVIDFLIDQGPRRVAIEKKVVRYEKDREVYLIAYLTEVSDG